MARADIRVTVQVAPRFGKMMLAAQLEAERRSNRALIDGIAGAAGGRGVVVIYTYSPEWPTQVVTLRRPGGVVTRAEVRRAAEWFAQARPAELPEVGFVADNPRQSMQPWINRVLDDLAAERAVSTDDRLARLRSRFGLWRSGFCPNDTPLPLP